MGKIFGIFGHRFLLDNKTIIYVTNKTLTIIHKQKIM